MRISIVGLPLAGKTTFFTMLTQRGMVGSATGKKGAQIATAFVPDERLDHLIAVYQPKKQAYASVEFINAPSMSAENAGSGLSSATVDELRRADTFCLVIREFDDPAYPHPFGSVNGRRDLDFILNEIILSDLMIVEKRVEKLRKSILLTKRNEEIRELELLERIAGSLESEQPVRELTLNEQEEKILSPYQLLSQKPLLIVLNISEDRTGEMDELVGQYAQDYPKLTFTAMCATLEAELAQMEGDDAKEFMADLGIAEPAFKRILKAAYQLLNLQVFFTVGHDECRAWPMPKGGTAYDAAGAIHSDFQRGFIRAIDLPYAEFAANPTPDTFKREATQKRKEDLVQDGDLIEFRFNVSK